MASEDECLDALRKAASRLGKSPSKAEYEALGLKPASATVIRTLGGWNDAKAAAGLSTNTSTGSRVGPPPDGVSEEVRERWEELSIDQRWHYRNREWNTERSLQRRAGLRQWISETKAAAGCGSCDEEDSRCLDYHHCDTTEKTAAVNQLVTYGASKERIREELTRCLVLCANCHREEHAEDHEPTFEITFRDKSLEPVRKRKPSEFAELTPRERRRLWVDQYKQQRGCNRCGHDTAASLVLHHVEDGEKGQAVSRLISDGYGPARIRRELNRCKVLCSNCHRKQHRELRD